MYIYFEYLNLLFHTIIEIDCLLLLAAILVFKCAEGVGGGV